MLCTIVDAISNTRLARTKIIKTVADEMVLGNSNGEAKVLLDLKKRFKLIADDGSYSGEIRPFKMSKSYITVKTLGTTGRDQRRFIRMKCNIKAKVYSGGSLDECEITELAYGSCVINSEAELLSEENATVQFELDGASLAVNGVIQFQKENVDEQDDLWFSGYDYIISFDECDNIPNTMDELYGILLRMVQEERIAAMG